LKIIHLPPSISWLKQQFASLDYQIATKYRSGLIFDRIGDKVFIRYSTKVEAPMLLFGVKDDLNRLFRRQGQKLVAYVGWSARALDPAKVAVIRIESK